MKSNDKTREKLLKEVEKLNAKIAELGKSETERKQAEGTLAESELQFRSLSDASMEGIGIIQDGNVLIANSKTSEIFGYDHFEIIGKPMIEFVALESRELALKNFSDRFKEPFEIVAIRKNGSKFLAEVCGKSIEFKGHSGRVIAIRDITERKKTEKALQTSEERFRQFFANSPEYCFIISLEGTILDINKSALKALGYLKKEIVGKPLLTTIYTPSSQEKAQKLFVKWRTAGGLRNEELNIITKDGKERTVLLSVDAIRGTKGEIIHSILVQRDITERKQAEEALRESEEKYRTLIDNVNIGVYRNTAGPKGKFIEVNPAIIKMFGYKNRKEFLGINVTDLYQNPEDRKKFNDRMLKDGFVKDEELLLKKKDGTRFFGSVSTVAIKNGKGEVIYYDGVITNITERKHAEETLRESEEKYYQLFTNIGEGVATVDLKENFVYCNPAAEMIFGVPAGKLVGKNLIDFLSPQMSEIIKSQTDKRKAGEKSTYKLEIITPTGKERQLLITVTPQYDKERNVIGAFGNFRDITERKQAEEELHKRLKELEIFNRISVGRELRMVELKQEINELLVKYGKESKYKIAE